MEQFIKEKYEIKKELDRKEEILKNESIKLRTSILDKAKQEIELQLIQIELNKRLKSNGRKRRADQEEEQESQFGEFSRKNTHLDPSFVS